MELFKLKSVEDVISFARDTNTWAQEKANEQQNNVLTEIISALRKNVLTNQIIYYNEIDKIARHQLELKGFKICRDISKGNPWIIKWTNEERLNIPEDSFLTEHNTIEKMSEDEVRLKNGKKIAFYLINPSEDSFDPKQIERYRDIESKSNIIDGYEFRIGEFGVECRRLPNDIWTNVGVNSYINVVELARKWIRRREMRIQTNQKFRA